jgi:hypothetical protein
VFEFIGVDEDFKIADLTARNISANRTNVDQTVYDYLKNYFRPYNQALYQLISQDFGWDSEQPESI